MNGIPHAAKRLKNDTDGDSRHDHSNCSFSLFFSQRDVASLFAGKIKTVLDFSVSHPQNILNMYSITGYTVMWRARIKMLNCTFMYCDIGLHPHER